MEFKDPPATGIASVTPERGLDEPFFLDTVSPAVRALEHIIAEIAPTDIPVLLVGESGSGKEVTALRIHRLSRRREERFFKLVCATVAPEALEQPLHAAERATDVEGVSSAGTVFLDEISDLDPACQLKLLQVLPDGDVIPHAHCLRARVISSTGRNLEEEIRAGRFREDLYYRLNGVCLRLPPLRNRKEDIPAVTDFFLAKYATQLGRPKPSLSSRTLGRLLDCSWPGNVRQLEYVVKKIVALGDERLALGDLGTFTSEPNPPREAVERFSLKQVARTASRQAERELILKALDRTHWNRKRAAQQLQISYKALLYKLKQIGLDDSAVASDPQGERE